MVVLANQHISNIGGCPVCKNGAEDIKHVIFTCDRAKAVWSFLGVWEKILEVSGTDRSGSVIIEEVLRRGGDYRSSWCRIFRVYSYGRLVSLVGETPACVW